MAMFEKSKFPRINAIMDRLKGPRFIPKGYIKLHAALGQIGSAKVPGWSGDEIVEKSWHDENGNETEALVRWREAVDLFRQELFVGRVVASYLNNDGVIVAIPGSNFAQNDIEHIFREGQEQGTLYFIEAKDLNPQSAVPGNFEPNKSPPPVSEAQIQREFAKYKKKITGQNTSREETMKWGRDLWGYRITQQRLWNLDGELAKEQNRTRGPKPAA